MYIIFYIRFMFNKRNKEKRCTAFFSTNFNFFYPASRSLENSRLLVLLYSFYLFKRQFVQYNILIIYIQNIFSTFSSGFSSYSSFANPFACQKTFDKFRTTITQNHILPARFIVIFLIVNLHKFIFPSIYHT